jgi:hypothetical protein
VRWLVFLVACNTAPLGLGQRCSVGEACGNGAVCLDIQTVFVSGNDAGCFGGSLGGTLCSRVCDGGSDCAGLGADVACSRFGCGSQGVCLRSSDAGGAPGPAP